mmetsp:Transcript_18002/g.48991  ORF Transcript_18002/g.48991 Transcript_18002/m.48991 type:complete len:407 (-) Transcript_18002:89-1309(-)|eukprot:CAMPEP_0168740768 /NCGR_PEP_ID=MMETSP0724-20121128/12158_1 /TAXON_ID=265536 /ORGANISM="Amphiprora sp., Strain CCMP467" /LENGTH=406 /DNA_ID=CAMNT_0008788231 /DNA_START=64 /DNA_END=1284 /DNA_ORIENTATION=-
MVMEDFHAQQREQKKKEHSNRKQARSLHATFQNDDAAGVLEAKRLKEEERRKQQEARDMYSKYQGTVTEEDMKLTKMKEEERRKRRESQEEMQKYQNDHVEINKNNSKHKRTEVTAPLMERKADEFQVAPGTVQSQKGKFSQNTDFDASWQASPNGTATPEKALQNNNGMDDKDTQSHEALIETTTLPYQEHATSDEKKDVEPETESEPTLVPEPTSTTATPSTTAAAETETVLATTDATSSQPTTGDTSAAATSADATTNALDVNNNNNNDETKQFKIRLDVLFSFGLLTSSEQPFLDHYMSAVETVVKDTIAHHEQTKTKFGQNVKYDPSFGPFVQEYAKDQNYHDKAQRDHVQRIVVIAAIPVFITTDISIQGARQGVCKGLQQAMQTGEFIAIAKKQQPSKK